MRLGVVHERRSSSGGPRTNDSLVQWFASTSLAYYNWTPLTHSSEAEGTSIVENAISLSFIDQILERVFKAVSEDAAFDDEMLERLKGLARSSELTDFKKIVEVLSSENKE